jgi:hypothetical protein
MLHTCAWCNQEIPEGSEVFGFGARSNSGIDLRGKEGQFVSLQLALIEKTVVALVPATGSTPRKDGFDLVFITCSRACAQELKAALEFEKDVCQ